MVAFNCFSILVIDAANVANHFGGSSDSYFPLTLSSFLSFKGLISILVLGFIALRGETFKSGLSPSKSSRGTSSSKLKSSIANDSLLAFFCRRDAHMLFSLMFFLFNIFMYMCPQNSIIWSPTTITLKFTI
jgi:hypothetical protein